MTECLFRVTDTEISFIWNNKNLREVKDFLFWSSQYLCCGDHGSFVHAKLARKDIGKLMEGMNANGR